jgi:hypothetical protein
MPVTEGVVELDDLRRLRTGDREDFVPRGTFVAGDEAGRRRHSGEFILNLDDVVNTKHGGLINGCCGIDGLDGINTFCDQGHEIGTEVSDCWTPRYIHIPARNLTAVEGQWGAD